MWWIALTNFWASGSSVINVFLKFLCFAAISFCSGLPNGNYKDPNNCYGFISCSNGLTYHMDCPAGLRYNYTINQCDWPANVPCDQGMCFTIKPVYYQAIPACLCACALPLWGNCRIGEASARALSCACASYHCFLTGFLIHSQLNIGFGRWGCLIFYCALVRS